MNESDIVAHIRALRDCNQRGGRMLSLVDLVEAGTADLPLAAYLGAVMRGGGSLLVGARPGGAGKTAVMVALLNFLPDETAIQPIEGPSVLRRALEDTAYGETCYLAHEIGDGFYYAYIWDEEARLFFRLAHQGHIVASNLHADTLSEMQAQLCGQLRVDPAHLAAVTLKVFLRTRRGPDFRMRRWVSHVYESDGETDRLVWSAQRQGVFNREAESRIVTPDAESEVSTLLASLQSQSANTIEEVRRAVVEKL
ncbi:MAG: hypothetical protein ACP5HS_14625 [Anaerolineae bacterium]